MAEKLTNQQEIFCNEYIFDWNGTRAYKVAYPKTKNDNVAGASAHKLLRITKIQSYISEIKSNLSKTANIGHLKVLREYEKIGFSNIADLFKDWTTMADFDKLTDSQKAAISEISYKKQTIGDTDIETEFVKIKMHDKAKALESILKMIDSEEKGNDPQKIIVELSKESAKKINQELEENY